MSKTQECGSIILTRTLHDHCFFFSDASWPNTSLSASAFLPRSDSRSPQTGVRIGTNMDTRCWYARYASGYLDKEMLSVKRVEEKKSPQTVSVGTSGQSGVILLSGSAGSLGLSGARRGKRLMRTYVRLGLTSNRYNTKDMQHTQKLCSQKKFGCRDQPHSPRVTKPRFASASVHWMRAPGHSFFMRTPERLKVW